MSQLRAEKEGRAPRPLAGFGARVRAARGFSGLSQRELADRLNALAGKAITSGATIKRLEADVPEVKGSLAAWSADIADATGVPAWFLEHGWEKP
jgi:transcriptional regulator with XRE-family HTH domain